MIVPKNPVIWHKAPFELALAPGEIHVWRVDLTHWDAQAHFILNTLSEEELGRGQRFVQERHRRRFYTAKAFLRRILAGYLQTVPLSLRFEEGEYGKPSLVGENCSVHFNMTHSEDLALYAFSREIEMGIDTEYLNKTLQVEPLIERCLSQEEAKALMELPLDFQQQAFYDLWTRKEAYLKAWGWGLGRLDQACALSSSEVNIISFEPVATYTAAVAWRHLNQFQKMRLIFFEY